MPLAVIHMSAGALDDSRLIAGSQAARSIARVDVMELPPNRTFIGGHPHDGAPVYRIEFCTPAGAMDSQKRKRLVWSATDAILRAEGADLSDENNRHRVWCIVTDVPDGNWACAGDIYTWDSIKRWVLLREIKFRKQMRKFLQPSIQ
jgi:phenylpyruvate tautomerase PptA (4-oxalocrotonate tautomerase family)